MRQGNLQVQAPVSDTWYLLGYSQRHRLRLLVKVLLGLVLLGKVLKGRVLQEQELVLRHTLQG